MFLVSLRIFTLFLVSLVTSLFAFFVTVQESKAALLYFDPLDIELHRGDTVALDLRVDTDENECINAIDALIHYDESIIAVDVSRGDSILTLWVESPTIDIENRTISFAGGIPSGYCGRIDGDPQLTNVVATILFRSPGFTVGGEKNPTVNVSIDPQSQVLLHDGFGTPAPLSFQNALITLLDTAGTSQSDVWNQAIRDDDAPPSDFSVTLTSHENAFGGRYFIVFNALDKQSGIDHYEVLEEPISDFWLFRWGRADAPWERAESPYVLQDQDLQSTIFVKAIDKAGNESITKLVPDPARKTVSQKTRLVVTGAGAFIVLLSGLFVYGLWKRNSKKNEDTEV